MSRRNAPLIYGFYGFPSYYYEYEYPYKGSPAVAKRIIDKLEIAGVQVERVNRSLDHGVWMGFLAAFNPKSNPLNVPIVQVSLYGSEDHEKHYCLGQALGSLREEEVLIIGAGMVVHNLLDYRATRGAGKSMPCASTFDGKLKDAVISSPTERRAKMIALMRQSEARRAHPTAEHIHPPFVVAGAAGSDTGVRLWIYPEASLNWAQTPA
ncbi:hypothetical protein N7468_000623 [Penicillium chermesinum]|uniref:Extradiol ring-cleavage dioxygenase class III enzyme subunit B domain-containing protein n=1 Tax=Penicillium chermesinum TaxID=63820 RepID=A0A9W9TYK5_9EURO|nr:uncharacterized protein N7468_000623 [Penicillium chermesinum]KAJ5249172.1 hypothetical protein N7468_000623 [Penicillium chermesinum]